MKKLTKLSDLQPDPENLNAGTERGAELLSQSIDRYGFGRSIVVDKNGVTIAGNKTLEAAAERNAKIKVIETDGDTLVVVQRKDLDFENDNKAVGLALADNRVAEINLLWNTDILEEKMESAPEELMIFFTPEEMGELLEEDVEDEEEDDTRLDMDLPPEPDDEGHGEGGREHGFPLAIVLPDHQTFHQWQLLKTGLKISNDTEAFLEVLRAYKEEFTAEVE